jgi:hypothetical protein
MADKINKTNPKNWHRVYVDYVNGVIIERSIEEVIECERDKKDPLSLFKHPVNHEDLRTYNSKGKLITKFKPRIKKII